MPKETNMKRIAAVAIVAVICANSQVFAFVGAAMAGVQEVRDEAYKAFMKLKAIETVKALRDNYVASVRYYDLYKQMNEGKGIIRNSMDYVGDVAKDNLKQARDTAMQDWVRDPGYRSDIDAYVRSLDERESRRVRVAADEMTKYIKAYEQGADLEKQSGNMSSVDAQRATVRAQAIEIQLLSSLNTEMSQLLLHFQRNDAEAKRAAAVEWASYQNSIKEQNQKVGGK